MADGVIGEDMHGGTHVGSFVCVPADAGKWLLPLARTAIADALTASTEEPRDQVSDQLPRWLDQPGATFVTLTHGGRLRGCIGSLVAHRRLADDLRYNAVAAATADPRFPRLTAQELNETDIEVSVLSPPEPMRFASRAELESQLRPGVDGLILTVGSRRATFLPQVWDQLPTPEQFVDHLLRKAGISPAEVDWTGGAAGERYTVTDWAETDSGRE